MHSVFQIAFQTRSTFFMKFSKIICSLQIMLALSSNMYAQIHKQDTIVSYLIGLKKIISSTQKEISVENVKKRDSLIFKLSNLKDDSLLVNAYENLSAFYAQDLEDYENSWKMSEAILAIAKRTNNRYYYMVAYNGFGVLWYVKGNYVEALKEYELALQAVSSSNIDSDTKIKNQAILMCNIGATFQLLNDWDNGLSYYLQAIDKLLLVNDSSSLSTTYYNVSYIYSDINEWKQSYVYILKATEYVTKGLYLDVVVLSRAASVCIQLDKLKEAQHFLNQANRYELSDQNNLVDLNYYCALGQYVLKKKDYITAEKHLNQAYVNATLYGDPYWVAVQARELGILYLTIKNYTSAKHFFTIAEDISREFDYQPQVLQSFGDLSGLARARGFLDEAITYKDQQIAYSDSLVKKQNHNRILYYSAKFEADKKQNEITQLQKDNEIKNLTIKQNRLWLYLTITVILTLIVLGLLTYRNLKHIQDIGRQKEELQLQQINALEKDKQLILADAILKGQEQERGRLAKDLHDGLGGLLSGIKISLSNMKSNMVMTSDNNLVFERSLDMLDNSIQELRRVSHNMMPESLIKFGLTVALRDFCESINMMKALVVTFQTVGVERKLDLSQEIILYRIVQELMNNTLKHSGAQTALIQFMFESTLLSITVEDDGRGFDKTKLESTTGSGWANIKSRVEYLKGSVDVTTQSGEGTSVHIELAI